MTSYGISARRERGECRKAEGLELSIQSNTNRKKLFQVEVTGKRLLEEDNIDAYERWS